MMTDETRPMQSLSYGRNLLSQPSSCRHVPSLVATLRTRFHSSSRETSETR